MTKSILGNETKHMIDKQTYKYSWIYLDYNSDSLMRIIWAHYNLHYFYTGAVSQAIAKKGGNELLKLLHVPSTSK
jgi:hypothetical protein